MPPASTAPDKVLGVTDAPESSLPHSPVAWVALTIDCPDAEVQERLRHFYAQALKGAHVADRPLDQRGERVD